jgi:hypothetical protein
MQFLRLFPTEFRVTFKWQAAVELADNEKVSLWEPMYPGTVRFQKHAIQLDGKWRLSAIGRILPGLLGGALGELIRQRFFLKERSETISAQNLERAMIRQKKQTARFHLFQTRDQGMVEVHVFKAEDGPQVIEALKGVVPASVLHEQSVS